VAVDRETPGFTLDGEDMDVAGIPQADLQDLREESAVGDVAAVTVATVAVTQDILRVSADKKGTCLTRGGCKRDRGCISSHIILKTIYVKNN